METIEIQRYTTDCPLIPPPPPPLFRGVLFPVISRTISTKRDREDTYVEKELEERERERTKTDDKQRPLTLSRVNEQSLNPIY